MKLRSVFVGYVEYESLYTRGIAEASARLGIEHTEVSIRTTLPRVDWEVRAAKPDLIWGHMLFWAPHNTLGRVDPNDILELVEGWKRDLGCKVVLHDGDPRKATRFPHDISSAVDLVLANHLVPRREWCTTVIQWPFAAPTYAEMAGPVPEFSTPHIAFTGTLRDDALYGSRTACLRALQDCDLLLVLPRPGEPNTLSRSAEVAASATAVIGFGQDIPGWIDTRVFQYAGAGGVLLHDDVGTLHGEPVLIPHKHYIPVKRYDVDSILGGLMEARRRGPEIREAAFTWVQSRHTWVHRVQEVLDLLDLQ